MMISAPPRWTVFSDVITVPAGRLVGAFGDMAHEGNVFRITVCNEAHQCIAEFPVGPTYADSVILPRVAALVAIADLDGQFTLRVDRLEIDGPRD